MQPPPAPRPIEQRQPALDLLDDQRIERLGSDGFFVVDGFLGTEAALAIRGEALALSHAGTLRPAGLGRGDALRLERAARGDEIAWLDPQESPPALRAFLGRLESVRDEVNRGAYLGLRRYEVQVARYDRGAGYVRHRDAFPGGPNRTLTAIYYLNDGWIPAHGGALRLFPTGREPLELAPLLDRLVVFRSADLEHEVCPSWAERLAVTAWFYGREDLPR
ncbi:2OG-Fe(II) oxygenase [Vulgatibacter sp.]|uniref:2OG-Fe(II) oxygenase n=1 Tax=Vulgatibacter sp. TaxID=1971226 RepID=UPI003566E499